MINLHYTNAHATYRLEIPGMETFDNRLYEFVRERMGTCTDTAASDARFNDVMVEREKRKKK